jgi:hypothetical protein
MTGEQGTACAQLAVPSVVTLNKHTTSPEFTAKYKKWLEKIGPGVWSKTAKADYEKIIAEEAAAKQAEKQPVDGK